MRGGPDVEVAGPVSQQRPQADEPAQAEQQQRPGLQRLLHQGRGRQYDECPEGTKLNSDQQTAEGVRCHRMRQVEWMLGLKAEC